MYRGCSPLYDIGIKNPILMDRTLPTYAITNRPKKARNGTGAKGGFNQSLKQIPLGSATISSLFWSNGIRWQIIRRSESKLAVYGLKYAV